MLKNLNNEFHHKKHISTDSPHTESLFSCSIHRQYGLNFEHYSWWREQKTLSFVSFLLLLEKVMNLFLASLCSKHRRKLPRNGFIIANISTWTFAFRHNLSFHFFFLLLLLWAFFNGKSFLITYRCCGFLFHFTLSLMSWRLVSHRFASKVACQVAMSRVKEKNRYNECNTSWKLNFEPLEKVRERKRKNIRS